MKPPRKYASATAFRVALESRLKKLADEETLDLQRLRRVMRRPVFIDTRNLFDPEEMSRAGFEYSGLGRGKRHVALAAH